MTNITDEHLHHMARRHHATMKQLDGIREKIGGITGRFIGTIETGVAAWLGGVLEGRTGGGTTVLNIPINLTAGAILLAVSHLELAKGYSDHLNNLGNGLVDSWVAATGYSFGKRWKETGKMLGGGGHPWAHPYENGGHEAPGGPPIHGDLSEAQMAAIVQRMQAAAHAPAHP